MYTNQGITSENLTLIRCPTILSINQFQYSNETLLRTVGELCSEPDGDSDFPYYFSQFRVAGSGHSPWIKLFNCSIPLLCLNSACPQPTQVYFFEFDIVAKSTLNPCWIHSKFPVASTLPDRGRLLPLVLPLCGQPRPYDSYVSHTCVKYKVTYLDRRPGVKILNTDKLVSSNPTAERNI